MNSCSETASIMKKVLITAVKILLVIHTCFSFAFRCGDKGIKVECVGNNDTLCNDKVEGMV